MPNNSLSGLVCGKPAAITGYSLVSCIDPSTWVKVATLILFTYRSTLSKRDDIVEWVKLKVASLGEYANLLSLPRGYLTGNSAKDVIIIILIGVNQLWVLKGRPLIGLTYQVGLIGLAAKLRLGKDVTGTASP